MLSQKSQAAYLNSLSNQTEISGSDKKTEILEQKEETLKYLNQLNQPEEKKQLEAIKGLRPYFAFCRLAALKKPATPKKPKWTTISRCAKDALNQAKKSIQTMRHPGPKK